MSTVLTGPAIHMYADNMALNALAMEINHDMQLTRHATGLEALRTRGTDSRPNHQTRWTP